MKDYVVDQMREEDWAQVRGIYLEGIATSQATFEAEVPIWEKWNAEHLPYGRLVARSGENIKGWCALSPVSGRCIYAGVAETSVYVGHNCPRGRSRQFLLEALLPIAESNGLWTLQAGVFPENVGSIRLHKKFGFREVGRRERIGRLKGVWRDTILLERRSKVVGID